MRFLPYLRHPMFWQAAVGVTTLVMLVLRWPSVFTDPCPVVWPPALLPQNAEQLRWLRVGLIYGLGLSLLGTVLWTIRYRAPEPGQGLSPGSVFVILGFVIMTLLNWSTVMPYIVTALLLMVVYDLRGPRTAVLSVGAALYLLAGLGKMGNGYGGSVGALFLVSSFEGTLHTLGYLALKVGMVLELVMGVLLLLGRTRISGALIVLVHLTLIVLLNRLGYGLPVVPWNLQMALLGAWLLLDKEPAPALRPLRSRVGWGAVAGLFALMVLSSPAVERIPASFEVSLYGRTVGRIYVWDEQDIGKWVDSGELAGPWALTDYSPYGIQVVQQCLLDRGYRYIKVLPREGMPWQEPGPPWTGNW